jgi:antitoxin MazE6
MKTAVSISDELFREIDTLARERKQSRSEIFSEALREYLEKRKSLKLFDTLNEVCADVETHEDLRVRRQATQYYAAEVLKEVY